VFPYERILLAPFTWDQAQQYLKWVNHEETAAMVTRALPVTPAQHQKWYDGLISRSDAVVFSVLTREQEAYLGNVWLWGIHPVHRSAELRILLGPHAKGQGYGSEATRALLQFAFRHLNLHKVFLYVLADNPAAVRAFEKAGLVREGTLHDEFYVDGEYRLAYRMAALAPREPA